jgi:hypothetical protein
VRVPSRLAVQVLSDHPKLRLTHGSDAVPACPPERTLLLTDLMPSSQQGREALPALNQPGKVTRGVGPDEQVNVSGDQARTENAGPFLARHPPEELQKERGTGTVDQRQSVPGGPDNVVIEAMAHTRV